MAHDVFVSYSIRDKDVADTIVARLEAKSVTCWIAPRDVVPGADWGESIIDGIESSRIMILIFSKSANESSQIKREVECAVNKGVYIIPFRIEDIPPTRSLEYFISTSQWMDAFAPPMERHLNDLAKTVKAVLAIPSPPKPVDIEAPANLQLPKPVDIAAPVTAVGRTEPVADGSTAHISSRSRMVMIATVPAVLVLAAVAWYMGHKREVMPGKAGPAKVATASESKSDKSAQPFSDLTPTVKPSASVAPTVEPSSPLPSASVEPNPVVEPSASPNDTGAQKLTKVFVKKYGFSVLLPIELFPDAATKLANANTDRLVSVNGCFRVAFNVLSGPVKKAYDNCIAEFRKKANHTTIDYKVLKETWFVVSGESGTTGYYTKGVKRGKDIVVMQLEYEGTVCHITDAMLTEMSHKFDGK